MLRNLWTWKEYRATVIIPSLALTVGVILLNVSLLGVISVAQIVASLVVFPLIITLNETYDKWQKT